SRGIQRLHHRTQGTLNLGIRHCTRTQIPSGAQRRGIDVRAERQHGDAALHQLANSRCAVRIAQLDDCHVEWLVPRRFCSSLAHDLLQLRAKEEIAALDEYALQPASFCVRYSTSLPAATRSCLRVSRSRTVTVWSWVDWPSMVIPYGVPASSWRR